MSEPKNSIKLFGQKRVRAEWDEEKEKGWFPIVDVVGVLTDQPTPRGVTLYWGKLKQRLKEEGSELLTKRQQLKITASHGKKRPAGFKESAAVAEEGAKAAKVARKQFEKSAGKAAVSPLKAKRREQAALEEWTGLRAYRSA